MFEEYLPTNYKVTCPFPNDKVIAVADTTAEATKNLNRFYRTGIGRLYWMFRNTKIMALDSL